MFKVISFYRYIVLDSPETIRKVLLEKCQELGIFGRILLAQEGINGAVSGTKENISSFKKFLEEYYSDLTYREQTVEEHVYHKLVVRVRKEIVALGKNVALSQTAQYISPQELKWWYDTQKDFVIIDARNEHEAVVGKFKNAVILPIKKFKDFPQAIETVEHLKNKTVVMYCTGGIRCEKASAYMKEQGFSSVYQLEGGILHYLNQYPETYYEGACFVFDDRLSSYTEKPISSCAFCGEACADYTNCFHLDCDALFVCCSLCRERMKNTCSLLCMEAKRQRVSKLKKSFIHIGVVENYYSHVGVALVRLERTLRKREQVSFLGRTTRSRVHVVLELRDFEGKELDVAHSGVLVTFLVPEKVREHDRVVMEEA